jgi:hypothetical protein
MTLLEASVYFCDSICSTNSIAHLACGVFFAVLLGHVNPSLGFWGATSAGLIKEMIDYFKHVTASANFNYLTDTHYGVVDGVADLLFWMIGGLIVFGLLRRGHKRLQERLVGESMRLFLDNPANRDTRPELARIRPKRIQAQPFESQKNIWS